MQQIFSKSQGFNVVLLLTKKQEDFFNLLNLSDQSPYHFASGCRNEAALNPLI